MRYYPIFLDVRGRPCLIVGGGEVAARKIEGLLKAVARVTVISPEITGPIRKHAEEGKVRHIAKFYQKGDLKGYFIAYAATGVAEVDEQMAEDARSEGVLLNVVDCPSLCGFITPSLLERGDLTIAIATGGKSPGFAKLVSRQLEKVIGPEYGEALRIVAAKRKEIMECCASAQERRTMLEAFMAFSVSELLRQGDR